MLVTSSWSILGGSNFGTGCTTGALTCFVTMVYVRKQSQQVVYVSISAERNM